MSKLTREERLAQGWRECWGVFDEFDGTWRCHGGWLAKPARGQRFPCTSFVDAAKGCQAPFPPYQLRPRRFWRRKPQKPAPAFEVGQWVMRKATPGHRAIGPMRVTALPTNDANDLNSRCYQLRAVDPPCAAFQWPESDLEPMVPGAVALQAGDVVEFTGFITIPVGTRGKVDRIDPDKAFPVVVSADGKIYAMRARELRLIRRDEQKPAAPPLKVGDRVLVELRVTSTGGHNGSIGVKLDDSLLASEAYLCGWIQPKHARRLP